MSNFVKILFLCVWIANACFANTMTDKTLKPGLFKHYKGMLHRVIGIARHTENQEEVVVYQNLFGDFGLRVRPYDMFIENVVVDGNTVPRFTFVKALYEEAPPLEMGGYKPEI